MIKILCFLGLIWCGTAVNSAPFSLPLFDSVSNDAYVSINPVFDMDGVLLNIIRCLPQKSKFKLNLSLVGRAGTNQSLGIGDNVNEFGRYYIGIVAKMPLYSSVEIERSVKWESNIRLTISEALGAIANNVVMVQTALREIGLYSALEKRSKKRIEIGVAFTEEQVKYLEKVIAARNSKNKAIAVINVSRLKLVSLCRIEKREQVNRALISIIERALNPKK